MANKDEPKAEPKGLHDAPAAEVTVDGSYEERPYGEAMTAEQKQTLKDEGLL